MTRTFNLTIEAILEKYDSENERMAKAMAYFAIGHQGEEDEDRDEDRPLDYCWIWLNGLKVGSGLSHNATFGSDMVDRARFKGWYDSTKDVLSFVDDKEVIMTQDEIPSQIYDHLMRKFNPGTIRVF